MKRLIALLLAAALMQPLAVTAEVFEPECTTTLYYDAGTVSIHFDSACIGGTLTVWRVQPEGEFPYYTYEPVFIDEAEMRCKLIEGDYKLEVALPSDNSAGIVIHPPVFFTVDDPDMDETQSFDSTKIDLYLKNDPDAQTDVIDTEDVVLENRTIRKTLTMTFARRDFIAGDMQGDGIVDASDAAEILVLTALDGSGGEIALSSMHFCEADVNGDGNLDASDAADILVYAASDAVGEVPDNIISFLKNNTEE